MRDDVKIGYVVDPLCIKIATSRTLAMTKFEFKAARELVDGDLIELRELPFRYTSEAKNYRSEDGDKLVRVGSDQGPHTPRDGGRLTLHTDVGDYDVAADLDFVLMGTRS